jgi:ribosomal protein S4
MSFRIDVLKLRVTKKTKGFFSRFFKNKQNFKHFYGNLKESYLKRLFFKAVLIAKRRGVVNRNILGDIFVSFLERRLDVVLFRSGLVDSLKSARQVILHGHVCVNGLVVSSSGFILNKGDVVSFKDFVGLNTLVSESLSQRLGFFSESKNREKMKKLGNLYPTNLFVDFDLLTIVLVKNFVSVSKLVFPFRLNMSDLLMFYKI